jgi:hypothetical protein
MAHLVGTVNLGDVGHKVEDTAGVAPLLFNLLAKNPEKLWEAPGKQGESAAYVIVPRDQLDEVLVEGDACLSIEDGGGGVAVQVGGDNLVLGVSENSWGKRQLCMLRRQRGTR